MTEDYGSPWDVGNEPEYKQIPEKILTKLWLCSVCGAAVVNRKIHNEWHRR